MSGRRALLHHHSPSIAARVTSPLAALHLACRRGRPLPHLPETTAQKEKRRLAIVGDDEGKIARARLVEAFSRAVLKSYDLTSMPPERLVAVLDEEHVDTARDTIKSGATVSSARFRAGRIS